MERERRRRKTHRRGLKKKKSGRFVCFVGSLTAEARERELKGKKKTLCVVSALYAVKKINGTSQPRNIRTVFRVWPGDDSPLWSPAADPPSGLADVARWLFSLGASGASTEPGSCSDAV